MIVYHKKSEKFSELPEKEAFCMILTGEYMSVTDNPFMSCLFAIQNSKQRFIEGEPAIKKSAHASYVYAENIIGGRWSDGEPAIMQDPNVAYFYANSIIRDRWPEAEPTIMKDPKWAYYYAKDVMCGRWSEAEPVIMQNLSLWKLYQDHIGSSKKSTLAKKFKEAVVNTFKS